MLPLWGTSHALIDWCQRQNHAADRSVEYSIGFDVDVDAGVRAAVGRLPADRWAAGLDNTTGGLRSDIDVAEITDLLRDRLVRTGWPKNMRVIVRRTKLAPGEQPTLFHLDGYKYSCLVTNTGPGLSLQLLDARHRAHARVADRVRTGKDTGLGHLPSKSWTVNLAWCHAVAIAVDLLAWLKLLGCPDIPTQGPPPSAARPGRTPDHRPSGRAGGFGRAVGMLEIAYPVSPLMNPAVASAGAGRRMPNPALRTGGRLYQELDPTRHSWFGAAAAR